MARALPLMSAMGITRIADVTGLDTIGIPVVMVCRPNSRSVSVSQGKGSTLAAAKASGLMESIEGFHAEHIVLPIRFASFNDLAPVCTIVDPASLAPLQRSRFHLNYPVEWIEGEDLISGQKSWLPFEMVHTNYTLPGLRGGGCFPSSSNGLASGNSLPEATVHGICELIERDALTLWHHAEDASVDSTSIDRNTIKDSICLQTLARLDDARLDTHIWDITTDTGIPSYLSVVMSSTDREQHIGVGSGTHLNKEVALLRALHEAVQVRTTYIVGARDDITPDEYSLPAILSKRAHFSRFIQKSTFSGNFSRTKSVNTGSVVRDLSVLLTALVGIGISQVLLVDLTKAEFEIPVVRVVIPGLEAPHDDVGYLPGERVRRVRGRHVKS